MRPSAKPAAGVGTAATTSPNDKKDPKSLPAGTYAVIPLIEVGPNPVDPALLKAKSSKAAAAAAAAKTAA